MSLKPEPIQPVPEETARIARAVHTKGHPYLTLRNEIGTIFEDEDFVNLFLKRGQPAFSPWRLALVTIMQFRENLSDRQAAEAVRDRLAWKYLLGLELTDTGFAFSVLSEFRGRLLDGCAGRAPETFNHYAVGWAHAMDTPYQWTKQVASHWGGTRNGTIVHWPKGIEAKGELRQQFHHVIDVVPTILQAAGIPEPLMVNGVTQKPLEGVSMNYTFDNPDVPDRHEIHYFDRNFSRRRAAEYLTPLRNNKYDNP